MSFTIVSETKKKSYVKKLLSSCEKYFPSEHEKRRNGVNCRGRVDGEPCQKKNSLRHATDEKFSPWFRSKSKFIQKSSFLTGEVHHGVKSWKLIYNLFSLFNLAYSGAFAHFFSSNKLPKVCFTIFQFGWWDVKTKSKRVVEKGKWGERGDGVMFLQVLQEKKTRRRSDLIFKMLFALENHS